MGNGMKINFWSHGYFGHFFLHMGRTLWVGGWLARVWIERGLVVLFADVESQDRFMSMMKAYFYASSSVCLFYSMKIDVRKHRHMCPQGISIYVQSMCSDIIKY